MEIRIVALLKINKESKVVIEDGQILNFKDVKNKLGLNPVTSTLIRKPLLWRLFCFVY